MLEKPHFLQTGSIFPSSDMAARGVGRVSSALVGISIFGNPGSHCLFVQRVQAFRRVACSFAHILLWVCETRFTELANGMARRQQKSCRRPTAGRQRRGPLHCMLASHLVPTVLGIAQR